MRCDFVQQREMFIRCTQTRSRTSGEPYKTYRLDESARVGNAVKQSTLLNLGSHFDLPRQEWSALAARIDELLPGQVSLLDASMSLNVQVMAQRYAAQLIALKPAAAFITPVQDRLRPCSDLGKRSPCMT